MKRREFISKSFKAGVLTGSAFAFGTSLFSSQSFADDNYDLIAIKGGEPVPMFDKAMEAFGGMKKFVKKGYNVVVKPNIGWDVSPERAGNTNPLLVKRIIEHCFEAGAKNVYAFDHTCDNWNRCYSNSGIEKAAKDAGAKVVSGDSEGYYQRVTVTRGKKMKSAKVHELILESDLFINVPVLKHHSGSQLTAAMKNLMGVVWDRGFWHRSDLHQCIADFSTYCKPHLNILDAYNVMKRNGPRGVSTSDIVNMKSLLISTDIVAIDAAGAKLFGAEPDDIQYIKIADEMKIGSKNLDKLKINRLTI